MINFHKPIAGGFTVGIMVMYVLAMSAPAISLDIAVCRFAT